MKHRRLCLALVLLLLSVCLTAAASMPGYSYLFATLNRRVSCRTGPGTRYDDDALTINSIGSGTALRVLSKAYDTPNDRWWVMVEFSYQGQLYRAYTGEQRFNGLDLNSVPTEYQLGTCDSGSYAITEALRGPGQNYHAANVIPAHTACTIWGYEENGAEDADYILVEYYDSASRCYRRCWVKEWLVDNEVMYYGWPGY